MEPEFVDQLPGVPGNRNRPKWIPLLTLLMERPDVWALIAQYEEPVQAGHQASNLKRMIKKPPGRWEFASRTVNGQGNVYARYVGPDN